MAENEEHKRKKIKTYKLRQLVGLISLQGCEYCTKENCNQIMRWCHQLRKLVVPVLPVEKLILSPDIPNAIMQTHTNIGAIDSQVQLAHLRANS